MSAVLVECAPLATNNQDSKIEGGRAGGVARPSGNETETPPVCRAEAI